MSDPLDYYLLEPAETGEEFMHQVSHIRYLSKVVPFFDYTFVRYNEAIYQFFEADYDSTLYRELVIGYHPEGDSAIFRPLSEFPYF
jgi:hypothetical protein